VNTPEPACYSAPEEAGLRIEKLPFDRIPHQSRLFLDYLKDPISLNRFYPSAVRFHHELAARSEVVLSSYKTNRDHLCDALERLNSSWGAKEETLNNINLLRSQNSVAVVTGQQVGFLTGPLYTIYKALTAIKLARCLTQRGIPAVPVFWMATEDHDWLEVARTDFFDRNCQLSPVQVSSSMHIEGTPVGKAIVDQSITSVVEQMFSIMPSTDFLPELENLVRDCYKPGRFFGDSFAYMMTALMSKYGLVLFDPLNENLKQLASPIYIEAIRHAEEIAIAINDRSRELEESGYHAQVFTSPDAFPLFIHINDVRYALIRSSDGRYKIKGSDKEYLIEELIEKASNEPQLFSPNVTLRAVVQDYLLPTLVYIGGAAEIAYFAQTSEAYRVLNRPPTPILHRASFTIIEPGIGRTLNRYQLNLTDFFTGLDHIVGQIVENHLGTETIQTFDQTSETINQALDNLQRELHRFEPTLADALNTGRRKINYQIEGLRTRFNRAQMERNQVVHRKLERAIASLYPEKALQERHVNITSLISRHGHYVLDWLYNAVDLSSNDHQVVYF
jgi:bacillithiol synthase